MDWLRFSNFSIGNMTTFIILCVILAYFISIKHKSKPTWFLLGYVAGLAILLISYLLRYTIFSPPAYFTAEMSNLVVFGVLLYILFAYHFPENRHPRESWVVPIVYGCVAAAVYISIIASGENSYSFAAHFFYREIDARIAIVAGFGYIWASALFLRKTALFSTYAGPVAAWLRRLEAARPMPHLKCRAVRIVLGSIKMFRPRGAEAKSLFAFALLALATFLISLSYLLSTTEIISRETYGVIFSNGALIISLSIFIVYINNSSTPSSLQWKVVGVSLATILVVLGIAGNIIYANADASYDARARMLASHVESLVAPQDFSSMPDGVVYVASRPQTGGPFSDNYEVMFPAGGNIKPAHLAESDQRAEQAELEKISRNLLSADNRLTPEQALMRAEAEIAGRPVPEMQRRYRYFDLHDTGTFFMHFDFRFGDRLYEVGTSYALYRLEMHRLLVQLVGVILGTTVLILVIYPAFYRKSLLVPFRSLLDGIAEVNTGKFDVTVPVYIDDEIGFLSRSFNDMLEKLQNAFEAIEKREYETLHVIGRAAEFRDPETANHIVRVASYSRMLARLIGESDDAQELIFYAAPLHDIGKIGVPDSVLLKNGKLTRDEFELIKAHPGMGHSMLRESSSSFLQAGAVIALSHHEKFDGSGYPSGVEADRIHVFGRIVAIADVFDALTTKRPYKEPWPIERALEVLEHERGSHFDPQIVDYFTANIDTVLDIRSTFSD